MYLLTGSTSIIEFLSTNSGSIESIKRGQGSNILLNAMKYIERMGKQAELDQKEIAKYRQIHESQNKQGSYSTKKMKTLKN